MSETTRSSTREHSALDQMLASFGDGLKALAAAGESHRPRPVVAGAAMSEAERVAAAALMRVNHAGEVAAQGLYHGQALMARDPDVRRQLLDAAREEQDHLHWCAARLQELGDGPSKLTPIWYASSAAIGALAGLRGDVRSLGFVAETERQVSAHLGEHLERLPASDTRSRVVLQAMQRDEQRHGEEALAAGGRLPSGPIRGLMRAVSEVMKFGAARI